MKAFVFDNQVLIPDKHDSVDLTADQYEKLTGKREWCNAGSLLLMNVSYKGFDNKCICLLDYVKSGKVEMFDLSKISAPQLKNLLSCKVH